MLPPSVVTYLSPGNLPDEYWPYGQGLRKIDDEERVIRGWRQYHLSETSGSAWLLGFHSMAWRGATLDAECMGNGKQCQAHLSWGQCDCGIYGRTDTKIVSVPQWWHEHYGSGRRHKVQALGPTVVALCIADGVVAEYSHGWRASRVEIERLYLFVQELNPKRDARQLANLAKRYKVPVEVIEVKGRHFWAQQRFIRRRLENKGQSRLGRWWDNVLDVLGG